MLGNPFQLVQQEDGLTAFNSYVCYENTSIVVQSKHRTDIKMV